MHDQGHVERSPKRVRAMLGGIVVVDSKTPLLVWEMPYYPTYFFPLTDVPSDRLTETGNRKKMPVLGEATFYSVKAGGREGLAYRYLASPDDALREAVAFRWRTMDHWFEEDEEVHVHARDPYKRVDILHSDRHVIIAVDGLNIAESDHPTLLFETSLPTRYYLPKTDVRMDLLIPTETHTQCPYKGTASFWSVTTGDMTYKDYVWSYPFPIPESQKIAGLMCFYNEKVDITLDGQKLERPQTPFS